MSKTIRVAAAGDIHAGPGDEDRVREAFRRAADQADLILLAGDLTQHGQVDEVCVVADACRDLTVPIVAVLGNHDWQSDRPSDLARALAGAGVVVLERTHTILPINGVSVGVAGREGVRRRVRRSSGRTSASRSSGRRTRRRRPTSTGSTPGCARSRAALSGSRCSTTRRSRRRWSASRSGSGSCSAPTAWPGRSATTGRTSSCTATPTAARSRATIDGVPVYNVAVHVIGREFWVFDLPAEQGAQDAGPLAVEET